MSLALAMAPAPRPQYGARQHEILDCATELFLRLGAGQVTIGTITEHARCSKSTVYEIARNKDDLFLVVLDRMMRRIATHARDAVAAETDPVRRIEAFVRSGIVDIEPFGPEFIASLNAHRPARVLFDQHIEQARDLLTDLIDAAVRERRFRRVDPRIVAEGLFAATLRFTDPSFASATSIPSSQALGTFFDVLIEGLSEQR